MSPWRQVRAIALLPGAVTVLVPLVVLLRSGSDFGWGLGEIVAVLSALLGLGLIAPGFALWLWTVRLFARIGRGTLAPWDPPQSLVTDGPYRHVRNPMITAVLTVLAGEAMLFGSPLLLIWLAIFFAINCVFFLLREEPSLELRFGDDYRTYRRNVPRWLPRRTAWTPDSRSLRWHSGFESRSPQLRRRRKS